MAQIFITLKGLKMDTGGKYSVLNDFLLYGSFQQIDSALNRAIVESDSEKMKFILYDESRMASYAYKFSRDNPREDPSFMVDLFNHLNLYLGCLWLAADFSVIVKEGVLFDKGEHAVLDLSSLTHYNSDLKLDFSYTQGESGITLIQLGEAKRYYRILKKYGDVKKSSRLENRTLRALTFINESRKTNNSYVRIAFLVMALECLLANQKGESVSNTALKTAYIEHLAFPDANFHDTYRFIKTCYDIRSRFVHGNSFTNEDLDKNVATSKDLELLIKSLIKKILNDEKFSKHLEQPSELINDFTKNISID